MANLIQPQQIIDLDGLQNKIDETKKAHQDFKADVEKVYDILNGRVDSYKKELQELITTLKSLNAGNNGAGAALQEIAVSAKETAQAQNTLSKVQEALKQSTKDVATALTALKREANQVKKAYSNLTSEGNKNEKASQDLINRYTALNKSINLLEGELKSAKKATKDISGSYNELNNQLKKDISTLKDMSGAFDTATGKINTNNKAVLDLANRIKSTTNELKKMDAMMGSYTRNVGNYESAFDRFGKFVGRFNGGIEGAIASFGAWGAAIGAVILSLRGLNQLVVLGDELRRSQIGIENVSVSAADAAVNIDFVRSVANRLGLEVQSLNQSFKLFAGATEGTALQGAKTREVFEGISVAAAAMQLSVDDTNGMFRAFSQMISKNTLQSEELKGQLAERLPSAIRLTAEALGKTTEELMKMMERGEVLAVDVLPLLAQKFQVVYGQDALKNVDTITGATNRLNSAWQEFLNSNTSPIARFLTTFYNKLADTLNLIANFKIAPNLLGLLTNPIGTLYGMTNDARKSMAKKQAEVEYLNEYGAKNATDRDATLSALSKAMLEDSKALEVASGKERDILEKRLKENARFYKKLSDMNNTQTKAETIAKEKQKAKDAELRKTANEKALKEAEKAAAQRLTQDRRDYQVEIRTLSANLKEELHLLEASYLTDKITAEDYANQKYALELDFAQKEYDIIEKYKTKNNAMVAELQDDQARNDDKFAKAQLEKIKNDKERLLALYKELYNDLKDSFKNESQVFKDGIEQSLNDVENVYNKKIAETQRNRNNAERKGERLGGKKKKSGLLGFDILITETEIAKVTEQLQVLTNKYDDSYQKIADDATKAYFDIDKLEVSSIEKERMKLNVTKETEEALYKLKEHYKDKERVLNQDYQDWLQRLQEQGAEKSFQTEKERLEKITDVTRKIVEFSSQLNETFMQLTEAYSNRNIARLEKQKDYELSIAGKTAEDKAGIEADYEKKIIELRKKQDKREKLSAIFEIILKNQVAKANALASGDVAMLFLTGIMGQIALATAIATPLPEYFKGKKKGDAYEGLAIVGDRGAELVERNGKETLVTKPTVMAVDKKTEVFTAQQTAEILSRRKEANITTNVDDNLNFVRASSTAKIEQLKYAFNSTYNASGLQELKGSISTGINEGFDKTKIVINTADGSQITRKGNTQIRDNTKRRYR